MSSELRNSSGLLQEPTVLTRTLLAETFVVNAGWCRGLEACFIVLAALIVCLLISIRGRRCNLDGEPNSLLESMLAIASNQTLLRALSSSEYIGGGRHKALTGTAQRYRLCLEFGQGPVIKHVVSGDQNENLQLIPPPLGGSNTGDQLIKFEKHWVLRPLGMFLYLFYFGFLLVLLTWVRMYDMRRNGMSSEMLIYSNLDSMLTPNKTSRFADDSADELVHIQDIIFVPSNNPRHGGRSPVGCAWSICLYGIAIQGSHFQLELR